MEIQFDSVAGQWSARTPQAGAESGWSDWYPIDRLAALRFIERGWSFTYQ